MKFVADYFNAEKFESLFFIAVGAIAIALACYFWLVLKQPQFRGIAVPFVLVALIQLTVGISVYFRSFTDIARVEQIIKLAPEKIQQEEIPRMQVVMKNFVLYRIAEMLLILLGIILILCFPLPSFWRGVGIGLTIQASLMLFLDYFAEKRGKEYLHALLQLIK